MLFRGWLLASQGDSHGDVLDETAATDFRWDISPADNLSGAKTLLVDLDIDLAIEDSTQTQASMEFHKVTLPFPGVFMVSMNGP